MIIPSHLLNTMADLCVRVEQIIYLPLAISFDAPSDALNCFVEEEIFHQPDHPLFEQWPTLREFADADESDPEQVIEAIQESGDRGFLIQVARPVMKYSPEGNAYSFSWGYYNTAWIYAPFFEVALNRAADWARERDLSERAAARPANGGAV